TGKLGDAPVVTNNPIGASYYATLPNKATESVRGTVYAVSSPTGKGVDFDVTLSGLPAEGGPFLYHIHAAPVPADGNCTGTLAHLDPFIRGEDPPCDPTQKQTCQVGDLSGKYGKINGTSFSATYTDLYASLVTGTGAFFGNRSIVVHYANKTRITCANF
ncbi:Cu,Zn superoxide dismutase-like protein, partial [Glonium stellatum]